jgi:hypothetical protein
MKPPASLFVALTALTAVSALHGLPAAQAQSCQVRSAAGPAPLLVELYTSEGCSSCPPADRWLSTLSGRRDTIALGFHVNYWDYIGWRDRFASDATTERQKYNRVATGSRQVYTPQVVAAGRDWPDWRAGLPRPVATAAPVALQLERRGEIAIARVEAAAGASAAVALAGWWAVVEDGHTSRVRSGENAGELLRHDHVVRHYEPVAGWPAAAGAERSLKLPAADPAHPRRVVFVVHEAAGQKRPVQALALAC